MKRRIFRFLALLSVLVILVAPVSAQDLPQAQDRPASRPSSALLTGDKPTGPSFSHRLIVELQSPPLVTYAKNADLVSPETGRINLQSPQAQNYLAQLQAEQDAFVSAMQAALPQAAVSTYQNELGQTVALTYQVAFNGLAIDPGVKDLASAMKTLQRMPGVKSVFLDYAHQPDLYASVPLINAPVLWSNPAIGGMANAGRGIKVASMDGGVHKDAPMFSGEGFNYPPGYPQGGLGYTVNNNGKIIASRAYFRTWDPPVPEDANPWPGPGATSHGVHTSGIMVGNEVIADYLGITETISGVAPGAWIMSYRVFYNSVSGNPSFYTAEGLAALDDIAADGPDVLNNSWGGGPSSLGGAFDALDQALINVANSGVFIAMSAGNAGPGTGTSDHPSAEYISVAASTTDATLAAGRLDVTAPEPVTETLKNIDFTAAGVLPDPGQVYTFSLVAGAVISPTNEFGCNAWTGQDFDGAALVVSRGPEGSPCSFTQKALNAQNAGAGAVIVYNHATGGDTLVNMLIDPPVSIPAFFVFHSTGLAMNDWYATNADASEITFDFRAYQAGNEPDRIIDFSSRGPGVGNVPKPDIAAPGVNILSQGYDPLATGEDVHLGFGQVSGTSMAAPHVSGAAALLRQVHPGWSNDYIKSALMTTAKYVGIYNEDGTHAGPLDMGAGRLDLTHAADPGVVISPPNVGFGLSTVGVTETVAVSITSVSNATETYNLSAVMITATNFTTPSVTTHPYFTVSPSEITLDPDETATISVTLHTDPMLPGDYQGYVVLDGDNHEAHFPVWGRAAPAPTADVLLIDLDFSPLAPSLPDYRDYYTSTLDALGLTYHVFDALSEVGGQDPILPHAAELSSYKAIVLFTGDNFYPNGAFSVPTPLTGLDMDRLTEYANSGGTLIVMGQDFASVASSAATGQGTFFYNSVLGGDWLQDSVTGNFPPDQPVVSLIDAPPAFKDIALDVGLGTLASVTLTGANEVPPVATTVTGTGLFSWIGTTNRLNYQVSLTTPEVITVTASHIHSGTVGVNGPVLHTLWNTPTVVSDTLSFAGSVQLTDAQVDLLISNRLYVNVHTTDHPGGEIRAQIPVNLSGDGAGNQFYIDEIAAQPFQDPDMPESLLPYMPILRYPGSSNLEDGIVGMVHRDQPTLERPGTSYLGRSVYTTFGLEGVNNGLGRTSREELLGTFLDWAMDEPTVVISNTTISNTAHLTTFAANLTSNISSATGVQYRWDFGDGTAFTNFYTTNVAGHRYETCGDYTVRVEAVDSYGNHTIGTLDIEVTQCGEGVVNFPVYTPINLKNGTMGGAP